MTIKSLQSTSLTNNVFYRSMLAGNDAFFPEFESDEFLEEVVLTSSASSVTFSSLDYYAAEGFKHLQIRWVGRGDAAVTYSAAAMRVNGDAGSNYARHDLRGDGSSVSSNAATGGSSFYVGNVPFGSSTANAFGAAVIDILDFASTSKNTTFRILSGDNIAPQVTLSSGLYVSTSAITSVTMFASFTAGRNWDTNSRFSLYGSKA
jgi:hypothetical protein